MYSQTVSLMTGLIPTLNVGHREHRGNRGHRGNRRHIKEMNQRKITHTVNSSDSSLDLRRHILFSKMASPSIMFRIFPPRFLHLKAKVLERKGSKSSLCSGRCST